jgi:hypothetical protein
LLNRAGNVGGIRIGHGLHNDGCTTTDLNMTHPDANSIFSNDHLVKPAFSIANGANFTGKPGVSGSLGCKF